MFGGALGMLVGGKYKKNSSRKHRTRRMKGGHSPLPLSPFSLAAGGENLGPTPPAGADNYNQVPTMPGSSTMVGGGYGYGMDSTGDVSSFAGSYFPVSKVCTAGTPDNNGRGGNNFGQGGGSGMNAYSPANINGGGFKKKRCGGSKKRRTMKKWRQRGCNRKGGSKKKSTKKSRR